MSLARCCLAGAIALLAACQVARADPPEIRLPVSKSPPPVLPRPSLAIEPAQLAPASAFAERASASSTVKLDSQLLRGGRAYALGVTARVLKGPRPSLAIRFREATKGNTFRTYRMSFEGERHRDYRVDFTAPAYASEAELALEVPAGAEVALSHLSLRQREPIAQTEPVTSLAGSFVPPGYALVFNDEFSGTELNRRKWFTRYIYSSESLDRLNDENQRYLDADNHRVGGGILQLVARRAKLSKPSGVNYESGMIRSDFTARYGFFEARVKMPGGLGVWPAFWLNSDVSEQGRISHPPEIDIFEFVYNGKDDKLDMVHSAATRGPGFETKWLYEHPRFKRSIQDYKAPFNFNEGWHTFGCEWTADQVALYIDGLKIYARELLWTYKDGTLAAPAHVLLNLAIGGQWAGRYGIDDAAFPQALAIDWVRVYQKAPPPP
jgi:beta-glucanase (GH16 family)